MEKFSAQEFTSFHFQKLTRRIVARQTPTVAVKMQFVLIFPLGGTTVHAKKDIREMESSVNLVSIFDIKNPLDNVFIEDIIP